MVATLTTSYFLLTANYGSEPNALDLVCVFLSLNHLSYFLNVFSLRVQLVVKSLLEKRDRNLVGDFIKKKVWVFWAVRFMLFQNMLAYKWSKCFWMFFLLAMSLSSIFLSNHPSSSSFLVFVSHILNTKTRPS